MGLLTQGPGVFFLFVAFLCLIISTVSTPIWDSVSFLSASVGDARIRLGIFGYCVNGLGRSACSTSHLGYRADDVVDLLGSVTGDLAGTIIHGLTYALVLVPIAAAVAFIAMIISLTTNVILDIIGSIVAGLAFLISLIALIVASVLFVTARSRINRALPGSPASLGPAYWLLVAATILLLLATFTVCFGSARARRNKRAQRQSTQPVMTEAPKRHWWQRNRY